MPTPKKKIQAVFYSHISGKEPVRQWLLNLTMDERKIIGSDIMSVEFSWPIGMPTVKSLGNGLLEVRSNLKNRISRVFFCIIGTKMILLHAIIKKDQKAPKKDLDMARNRLKAIGGKS